MLMQLAGSSCIDFYEAHEFDLRTESAVLMG